MGKNELAKAAGLKVYDCALPQHWLSDTAGNISCRLYIDRQKIYDILLLGVVWSYDDNQIFGAPVALTPEAKIYTKFF